jgi:hypothetical protein|tara:strand:+ start:165 stop:356 length:192 start_codon:yes stop_codon:yes gene_type:complete
MIGLVAQISQDNSVISKLAEELDTLFKMEIHEAGSYDLGNETRHSKRKSDEELLAALDKMPDV